MSWFSPRMQTSSASAGSSASGQSSSLSESTQAQQASAGPLPPTTPTSVPNLNASVCLNISLFRSLLHSYRLLDDGVTTRLNRAVAKSRSEGRTHSPSLLDDYATKSGQGSDFSSGIGGVAGPGAEAARAGSMRARDLGTSTYATIDQASCEDFWKELMSYWRGRQEAIRYCLDTVGRAEGPASELGGSSQSRAGRQEPRRDDDVRLLDADRLQQTAQQPVREDQQHRSEFPARSGVDANVRTSVTEDGKTRWGYSEWDARGSRAENIDEALRRQLQNELSIDAIIRARSLQAFKSRCNLFRLPDNATSEERKIWDEAR